MHKARRVRDRQALAFTVAFRSAVDLGTHDRDGLLIDSCRVPLLDDFKVGLAFLIPLPRLPAFLAQEVGS